MDDRLSMLPDDLVHKILSFISTKHAVQTSALSSRWRFVWTSMTYLSFSTDDFPSNIRKFSEFVDRFLSGRNGKIEVHSVKICFHQAVNQALLGRVLFYAFSLNLQHLSITCLLTHTVSFPIDILSSPSLKYLRLCGCNDEVFAPRSIMFKSTWELPALTTLHLDHVTFYDDNIFSKCANLKNLHLINILLLGSDTLTICHPQLSNLTLEERFWTLRGVNVAAPKLENLSIKTSYGQQHLITIIAPNLSSFLYHASHLLHFSTDLPYLEKADLCITTKDTWSGHKIATLLQWLHHAKFLTLNLEFIKPLISYIERISLRPPPFLNLDCLMIYPVEIPSDDEAHKKVHLTSKVKKYFLDGSPSATFTLISYEEIKENRKKPPAIPNPKSARDLKAYLQMRVEKEKG